ncbi:MULTISPECIES: polyprenol monophosphomannose synthase [unclassified Leifsonia]|uniref:polyprenol monophosphomannose synthase n=1 Tax=unclassified Leifsonia TaxID=2663824 RepID=UPI0006F84F31|nr:MULTISPECIES: polyprenol monophosphomannose synthase [unclassified Leifsonia]KQX07717.1 dolichol-phosphate mannosyltransferase [Leifsonia sp. Root1293]KRA11999.1 dolichol-phosphate mannosyltransferase [Leifsonia sp. Root60]
MNTIVITPTYNERDNIDALIGRLLDAVPGIHALIVDDDSPDGTGGIADDLADLHPGVHVLHRTSKDGLGAAYRAGFAWAIDRGYDVIVEMDADGSHQPEQLPRLLEALQEADMVIGSRWIPGGRVVGWPIRRRLLSLGGSAYARTVLGLPQRDVTGGYRVFTAEALRRIRPDVLVSQGYGFQVELLWRAVLLGLRVGEVPITFVERTAGRSKMNGRIILEAVVRITAWALSPKPKSTPPASGPSADLEPSRAA